MEIKSGQTTQLDVGRKKKALVAVGRCRPASVEERRRDPSAKTMVEWVNIEFGDGEPKITINRDLCG